MRRWLVLDTETTGLLKPSGTKLEDQPQIIELALASVVVDDSDETSAALSPYVANEISWLINPGVPLPQEIIKITGITDEMLKDQPSFAAVLPQVIPWFLGAHGMIAHNMPFDRGMLINELKRCGKEFAFPWPPQQVCTVAAYQHLTGRFMKTTALYERIIGEPLAQTHRALDDVRALVQIVLKEDIAT